MVEKQADGESKLTKLVASILAMAEEHLKSMEGMSRVEALAYVEMIFDHSDVVFGVWIDPQDPSSCVSVALKGDVCFQKAIASGMPLKLNVSALRCTANQATTIQQRFGHNEGQQITTERWSALVRYDDEIRAAADKLLRFGDCWVSELAKGYFALNEDRRYLPSIVKRLTEEAEQHLPKIVSDTVEEAERENARRWSDRFRYTYEGEVCSAESLDILLKARAQGYSLGVETSNTFTATKYGAGTSYLRSNANIRRFGQFAGILPRSSNVSRASATYSFREPMNFPKGTTLYETSGPRVAVLPDSTLLVDNGGIGGQIFKSASEYRAQSGDREAWETIKTF